MRHKIACEFLLIRYVPDVVKGEFINIGVILREASRPDSTLIRFARTWQRARGLDRELDGDLLDLLEAELSTRVPQSAAEGRSMLDVIRSSFSNCLQVTEPTGCLAESLPAEMDRLMEMYVEPMRAVARGRGSGRDAIASSMRRAFEAVGVWPLMRKNIAAASYTADGDPLRIDCGYKPDGKVRLFHAVSLSGDLNGAKVLAFAARGLSDGVRRVDGAELHLVAIVEALRAENRSEKEGESYRFGVQALEREGVRVATTGDLERIAETASREMRA